MFTYDADLLFHINESCIGTVLIKQEGKLRKKLERAGVLFQK